MAKRKRQFKITVKLGSGTCKECLLASLDSCDPTICPGSDYILKITDVKKLTEKEK